MEFIITRLYRLVEEGVLVSLHVTPGASSNKLDKIATGRDEKDRLRCRVTAAPEKGKANKAVLVLLAKKLRLPQSAFQIIAGQHSREKEMLISGDSEALEKQFMNLLADHGLSGA